MCKAVGVVVVGCILFCVSIYIIFMGEFDYVSRQAAILYAEDEGVESDCTPDAKNDGKLVHLTGCDTHYPDITTKSEFATPEFLDYSKNMKRAYVKTLESVGEVYRWIETRTSHEYERDTCPSGTHPVLASATVTDFSAEPARVSQEKGLVEHTPAITKPIAEAMDVLEHSEELFAPRLRTMRASDEDEEDEYHKGFQLNRVPQNDRRRRTVTCYKYNYKIGWSDTEQFSFKYSARKNVGCYIPANWEKRSATNDLSSARIGNSGTSFVPGVPTTLPGGGWQMNKGLYDLITGTTSGNYDPDLFERKKASSTFLTSTSAVLWEQVSVVTSSLLRARQRSNTDTLGDLRMTFSTIGGKPVSVFAKQEGSSPFSLVPEIQCVFAGCHEINWLSDGKSLTKAEMIDNENKTNFGTVMCMRLLSFGLILVSLMLMTYPLQFMAEQIPCVGDTIAEVVGCLLCCVNFGLALGFGMFFIAIAKCAARPLKGLIWLLCSCCFLGGSVFTIYRAGKGKKAGEPQISKAGLELNSSGGLNSAGGFTQPTHVQPLARPMAQSQRQGIRGVMQIQDPQGRATWRLGQP